MSSRHPRAGLRHVADDDFVVNGLAFLLIGLQLPDVIDDIAAYDRRRARACSAPRSAVTVIVVRLRGSSRRRTSRAGSCPGLARRDPAPSPRVVLILGWAGMRGAVSLAAALALRHAAVPGTRPDHLPDLRHDPRHARRSGSHAAAAHPTRWGSGTTARSSTRCCTHARPRPMPRSSGSTSSSPRSRVTCRSSTSCATAIAHRAEHYAHDQRSGDARGPGGTRPRGDPARRADRRARGGASSCGTAA